MKSEELHPWNVGPEEAKKIQEQLRGKVVCLDEVGPVESVAGIDVSFADRGASVLAAVSVLSYPALALREHATARRTTVFPYVSGLISFRQIPAVLDAFHELRHLPDLLICHGQGLAHPRRFGFACHVGVLTGIASVGVAKTRLIGWHGLLGQERGSWAPLIQDGDTIGAVLRTRGGVKPVFVSIGHKISLETAIRYVLEGTAGYRLPEPLRWAHRLASTFR